jgi:hypothetical protein
MSSVTGQRGDIRCFCGMVLLFLAISEGSHMTPARAQDSQAVAKPPLRDGFARSRGHATR